MTGATAGIVLKKAAPEPIVELPPDQRPEGADVAWIPGYWSWDDERTDFIWVSGVWRDIPPARQWVPGYWVPVGNGSQWISGFWGDAAQTEITYLPQPPKALEVGPSSPAPGPDNLWSPGNWVWQETRYDWQPGYWVPQQPDWVWSPAHYTWTPRGYVYVQGYWDRDIAHRGVMFAPVYYPQPIYRQPDYSYSPSIVIDLGLIVASLFVQPRSNHYYYGDYYDRRYEDRGIYPWHSKHVTRYGDDPIYVHYRSTQLRQDPEWDTHIAEQYRYRRDHVEARPPRTLDQQIILINAHKAGVPQDVAIGRSLADTVQSTTQPVRFTPVNMDERTRSQARGKEMHSLQSERAKIEAAPKGDKKSKGVRAAAQPVRMQMPVSPVVASRNEKVAGAKIPPSAPVAPQPRAVEGRSGKVKPQRAEANPEPQARTGKTEARQSPSSDSPQRAESRSKTPKGRQEPGNENKGGKHSGK